MASKTTVNQTSEYHSEFDNFPQKTTQPIHQEFGWTILKHLNEFGPFFIQPPMYIRKKNYSRNLSLVLEMIVENSEFWIPSSTNSSMDFWYLKNSQQNKTVIYHLELGI